MADGERLNDNAYKFGVNPFLWVIPLVLSGIGILMITSTTSPTSFIADGNPFQQGKKQCVWLLIALTGMVTMYLIPLKFWYKNSGRLLIIAWIMAWLPLIPGIGSSAGGASRWIKVPGTSFLIQPGEILCLALALHLAKLFTRKERTPNEAFAVTLFFVIAAALPLLSQPDLGSTILVFTLSMGMYVERFGWRLPLFAGGILGGIGFPVLIFGEAYRMRRVAAFLDPWTDPLDTGFQAIQGLIAFANGGFWGAGMGHGFQKLNYLPAAYTDFIYAAIGEELGLMGTLGVLFLFGSWVANVRRIYYRYDRVFNSSLTWGVALTVILPLAINVAGVTKLLPLTGMPLPFISYGGTSLLTMWSRVGLMMRLEKESYSEEENYEG